MLAPAERAVEPARGGVGDGRVVTKRGHAGAVHGGAVLGSGEVVDELVVVPVAVEPAAAEVAQMRVAEVLPVLRPLRATVSAGGTPAISLSE